MLKAMAQEDLISIHRSFIPNIGQICYSIERFPENKQKDLVYKMVLI